MTETKHPHAHALQVAQTLVDLLRPHCDWIEIGGSVRRGKPEVKDIEMVVVAHPTLLPFLDKLVQDGTCTKAEYGEKHLYRWGEKYRGILFLGIRCEIFLCDSMNRGWIYYLRTGPGDINTELVTRVKYGDAPFEIREGYIWDKATQRKLRINTEQDWFKLLNVDDIEPADRHTILTKLPKRDHQWGDISKFLARTLTLYTAQMAIKDPDAVDITVGSGLNGHGECLAPEWDMVNGVKGRNHAVSITEAEYTEMYLTLLRKRYQANPAPFKALLNRERLVLKCYCPEGTFCHRRIAADVLKKIGESIGIEVFLAGELQPEVQQLSLFDMGKAQVTYD